MSSKRAQEEKRIYNLVKTVFNQTVDPANLTEEMLGGMLSDAFIKGFRYTNKEIKLRTPAIVQVNKIARNRFNELFSGEIDPSEAITLFCTGIQMSGDHVMKMASLGVAFAIWVSDVLTEAGKMEDLCNILPEEFDFASKVVFDAKHSNDIIERIAYVCENIEADDNNDILDRIIKLIPQKYIERGIERYDKLAWDILEIVLKEFYDLNVQKENLIRMLGDSLNIEKLNNMSNYALESEYKEKMDIAAQLDALDFTIATMFSPLQYYFATDSDILRSASSNAQKVYEKVDELVIENPYELCGIFYVLKQSNDFRYWAMGPFATAVSFAAKRLPWTCDLEYEEPHGETDKINEEMYSLKYSSSMFESAKDKKGMINMSQLIYHFSGGGILPRRLNGYKSERMILENNGVPQEEVEFIATSSAILALLNNRNEYYGNVLEFDGDDKEQEEEQDIEVSDAAVDSIRKLINEVKDKLKKVSAENHVIDEQRKKLQKEYDALNAIYRQEHRELVDLRNYVFNQDDNGQEEPQKVELNIDYPYTVKHNVIVFGGHETWSKAIKLLFTNVRFINKDNIPNQDMIKNADIVWIQANSLGHSKYYKIIDVVRTYHIPLRYFSCASAEKCAEQIVKEDMK